MLELCESIDRAISNQNWHAALMVALTLPDMCGRIDYPTLGVGQRYVKWFDKCVGADYKVVKTLDPTTPTYSLRLEALRMYSHHLEQVSDHEYLETFLNGRECYALRCKYLHQGFGNLISEEEAINTLNEFILKAPTEGLTLHNNLIKRNNRTAVQLQVDIFSRTMAERAREWWDARPDKEAHEASFLRIS